MIFPDLSSPGIQLEEGLGAIYETFLGYDVNSSLHGNIWNVMWKACFKGFSEDWGQSINLHRINLSRSRDGKDNQQGEALETKTEEVAWLQEKVNLLERQLEHQGRLIQEGLFKDSPYLMVCAHRDFWYEADSTVTYEYIMLDVSNSDQPGGGDGTMDLTTGVFAAITGGYYLRRSRSSPYRASHGSGGSHVHLPQWRRTNTGEYLAVWNQLTRYPHRDRRRLHRWSGLQNSGGSLPLLL